MEKTDDDRSPIWQRALVVAATASTLSAAYLSLVGVPFLRRSAWIGMNFGLGTSFYFLFRDRLDESESGTEVTKSLFAGAVSGALLGSLRGSPITSLQCALFVGGACACGRFAKDSALEWIRRPPSTTSSLNLQSTISSWLPDWFPITKTDSDQVDRYVEQQSAMAVMLQNLDSFEADDNKQE